MLGRIVFAVITTAAGWTQQPLLDQGEAAMRAKQYPQALALLQQALAANPDDATANLLAAGAAVQLINPELAVRYGEHARALDPTNWRVDTTLVTAYAEAGRLHDRDEERAKLRALHTAAAEQDARETSGFLLDRFRAGEYTVDAVEYFAPVTKDGIYYRFVVHGATPWLIDVGSEPINEASWAQSHAEAAARGERQFQIAGTRGTEHAEYTSFSGTPDYDQVKARVVAIIAGQPAARP